MKPHLGALPDIPPVDQDLSPCGLIKPADEVGQGALSRAGLPDDRDIRPPGDFEIEVREHHFLPIGIVKGHVPEFHIPAKGLKVLPFWMEYVPVHFHNLLGIRDIRLGGQKTGQPLDVCLDCNQLGEGADQVLDGLHHADGIAHKGRERTDFQESRKRQVPTLIEDDSKGEHGKHRDRRDKQGGGSARADAKASIGIRILLKVILHKIPDGKRADRLCPGDALIEVARDLPVCLPDLPVQQDELFLEVPDEKGCDGKKRQDPKCQPRIQGKHQDQHADKVGAVPDNIHQVPGAQAPDRLGIAHDPRMKVPHAVLGEIRERERLQVGEGGVSKGLIDPHLHLPAPVGRDIVVHNLQDQHRDIERKEDPQRIERLSHDEVIQGIAVEQGIHGIDKAAQYPQDSHGKHPLPERDKPGEEPWDPEEPERFRLIFLFHPASSSLPAACRS